MKGPDLILKQYSSVYVVVSWDVVGITKKEDDWISAAIILCFYIWWLQR